MTNNNSNNITTPQNLSSIDSNKDNQISANLFQNNINTNENNEQNNNNNEENEEEENDEDLEVVSVLMMKILKTHFNFQVFFLFILSHLMWELPLYIFFSISWLNDIVNLIFNSHKLRKMKT